MKCGGGSCVKQTKQKKKAVVGLIRHISKEASEALLAWEHTFADK